jgi:hypothetical protein
MLDTAKEKLPQEKRESVRYVHSPAEDLSFLPDHSVDIVAAGAYHVRPLMKRLNTVRYRSTIVSSGFRKGKVDSRNTALSDIIYFCVCGFQNRHPL